MRKLYIDTNVLVDYAIGQEPACSHCKTIIRLAAESKIAAYISLQTLKDVYYLIGQRLKSIEYAENGVISEEFALATNEVAWAYVKQLGKQLIIVPSGRSEHEHAFVYRALHNDYEDNLLLAIAYAAKVTLLVTNDAQLRKHSPVATLSSAEAVALLNAEFAPRKD